MRNPFALWIALLAALGSPAFAGEAGKSVKELQRQIKKALDGAKDEEALERIKELSDLNTLESLKALFEVGIEVQIPKIYQEVMKLIATKTDDASLKFFEEEAKAGKEIRQVFLADILAEMQHDKAVEILAILADDKNVTVVRATIAALAQKKVRGSVEPLLKILERLEAAKDRGQVYQELRDALFEVTGQDFDVLEDWKKWWDTQKNIFDPTKKSGKGTQTRKPTRDTAPEFAGKKIFAKNVVFVIDTSGSMQYVMKDDIPGLSSADGSDSAGGQKQSNEKLTKENERLAKFWTRMEMAKRALLKALNAFDAKAQINIVEFNTRVNSMEKSGLIPAVANRKKARDWVLRMKWIQTGNTNTLDAIQKAFEVDKRTTEIYFLSDGIPSKDGKTNDPTDPILEKVESLNRFRKVKIHTFGYDPISVRVGMENPDLERANEFLKKLAKSTGGTFTLLKVTDEQPPKDFRIFAPQAAR